MNTVYSLTFFECDLNNSEFKVETHGPKSFQSEEAALSYLLHFIQPKLKLKFEELVYLGEGTGHNHTLSKDEFNDVILYSKSCGAKGIKRLLDLYFNNVRNENFHTGYKISAFPGFLPISESSSDFSLTN